MFDYRGPDAARALNALLKQGARATFEAGEDAPARCDHERDPQADGRRATAHGLDTKSQPPVGRATGTGLRIRAPRIGMYQPFGGGNMDEGWTRWVLEQYGFQYTTLHNADIRAGGLQRQVRRDHPARPGSAQMINGSTGPTSGRNTAAASAATGVEA